MNSLLEKADILKIITRELVSKNSNALIFLNRMVPSFTRIFELLYQDLDITDFKKINVMEAVFEIFMILAPIYFYFIAQPVVDNIILISEEDKNEFRQRLIDDVYERAVKITQPKKDKA